MGLPEQISRYISLREPQRASVEVLDEISTAVDYQTASLDSVTTVASEKSRSANPVQFDTEFPSLCFALATGVGKTRLMGACMYYLWKQKGYRNFFILAPNITIYDKLRAELNPAHPKYIFLGLSDFPQPEVYDGDNYLRFNPQQAGIFNQACVFVFNISKIFARTDTEFKFHRFNEILGNAFSSILQGMDDLVVLMDESHRYRAPKSLAAINHLRPVLGLEFTATPKRRENVIYSFGLAQAIGCFVKTPTVVTRTNLTTSDAEEIERLKLLDGMARHEHKKGRLAEYCEANGLPVTKPFVLISTRDTNHATEVRSLIEADGFCDGHYKGKVIEIHSRKTGAEIDRNVQRLLTVEQPTSTVEIVIHVNMLKEGWDVRNLYTIIPLRASISEILTEQTIGRGVRLPFGEPTRDPDLDSLEIISHDQYARLIQEARDSSLFTFKEIDEADLRPMKVERVEHAFVDLDKVLDRIAERRDIFFTDELTDEQRLNDVVKSLVAEQAALYERKQAQASKDSSGKEGTVETSVQVQNLLFSIDNQETEATPFDPIALEASWKERLRRFAHANISVPKIVTDTFSNKQLEPFDLTVNYGPFELVDQRVLSQELGSGQERMGERLEALEVENPRAFLAGRLIDAIDELDVANDKETALSLVDAYIAQINKPHKELKKIAHLYRDVIINDLKNQIESHIHDDTRVDVSVRSGFIKFRSYSKAVLARDGLVPYTQPVPRSEIRRYLFDGFEKSFYPQVPFDSTPEKDFAAILERDSLKWIRPPDGNVPINYRGHSYNPDFIAETEEVKYIVEVKARRELEPRIDNEVREKALAAIRWCKAASNIEGSKPWEYKLIPDDVIESTRDLRFVFSHAVSLSA